MDFLMRFLKKYFPVYLLVVSLFVGSATIMTRTVTAIAEALPIPRNVTIVIDPGHGGEDGGATSCTGIQESQLNLEISLRLRDLKHRVEMVNETADALLLSIHQNQFSDGRYSGAQVFFAPTQGSQSLAEQTQALLISSLNPGSKRACKPAESVYLMQHIRCTGILVECGFLSNREEEAALRTPEYQKKLCCVIASAADQFLTQEGDMV